MTMVPEVLTVLMKTIETEVVDNALDSTSFACLELKLNTNIFKKTILRMVGSMVFAGAFHG